MKAIVIDPSDNIVVVLGPVSKGDEVTWKIGDQSFAAKAIDDIPIYHKMASKDIKKGEPIVKYGQHIGIAGCDIKQGNYVHVHNVESHREDLK